MCRRLFEGIFVSKKNGHDENNFLIFNIFSVIPLRMFVAVPMPLLHASVLLNQCLDIAAAAP